MRMRVRATKLTMLMLVLTFYCTALGFASALTIQILQALSTFLIVLTIFVIETINFLKCNRVYGSASHRDCALHFIPFYWEALNAFYCSLFGDALIRAGLNFEPMWFELRFATYLFARSFFAFLSRFHLFSFLWLKYNLEDLF